MESLLQSEMIVVEVDEPCVDYLEENQELHVRCESTSTKSIENDLTVLETKRKSKCSPQINRVIGKKKKYKLISLADKLKIIERLEDGEKTSSVAADLGICRTTVRRIFGLKEDVRARIGVLKSQHGNCNKRRFSGIEESTFEKILYQWFCQQRHLGVPVSGLILKEKALEIYSKMNYNRNFKASNGWLHMFKMRHGIHEEKVQTEKLSSDKSASDDFISMFRTFTEIEMFDLDNVYNADETGLFWRCLPRKSLTMRNEDLAGFEVPKDRITVMVCANATGTHKIPLLIIDKAKQPRCFRNVRKLPVNYINQKNAWMDTNIFKHWFKNIFIPAVDAKNNGKKEKILLLLDNALSHPSSEELRIIASHCQVIFLPPNMTASIQPMNQGVIQLLKKNYRKLFCRELIITQPVAHGVQNFVKKWDLIKCVSILCTAWEDLTVQSLKNCWNNVLKGEPLSYEDSSETLSFINNVLSDYCTEKENLEWLNIDQFEFGHPILSIEDLINQNLGVEVQNVTNVNEESNDNAEELEEHVSMKETYKYMYTVYKWLIQQNTTEIGDLLIYLKIMHQFATSICNEVEESWRKKSSK